MRLLALLALLAAAPAWATQDGWPALHDVWRVAGDDVLNIRAEPSADAPIIGHFAPDATGIEVLRPDDRLNWGLVNHQGRSGWVSLAYLDRQPGQWHGILPERLLCAGTEPFWSLEIAADEMRFERAGEAPRAGSVLERLRSENRRDSHAVRGDLGGDATALLLNAQCSDFMSDREYGWRLELVLPGADHVLSGCCSLAP